MATRARHAAPTEAEPRNGGDPCNGNHHVEITWHDDTDTRRLRRVADILADILDNIGNPGDRDRP